MGEGTRQLQRNARGVSRLAVRAITTTKSYNAFSPNSFEQSLICLVLRPRHDWDDPGDIGAYAQPSHVGNAPL